VEAAQRALCPAYRTVAPDPVERAVYSRMQAMYRSLYFSMGVRDSAPVAIGGLLPELRAIADGVRQRSEKE
jgi:L-ribulokinase